MLTDVTARTDEIEKKHGWAITGISDTTISMSYRREIELVFDIGAFQQSQQAKRGKSQPNSRIDLWYIAASREHNPLPSTAEKDFFLQCIRDHVRGLPQSTTKASHLLKVVSAAWDKANTVANQVRFLNLTFLTTVTKTSDTSICVKASLVLIPLKTRVEVRVHLQSIATGQGVEVTVTPEARVVYGEQFNVSKMTEFLSEKLGGQVIDRVQDQTQGKMSTWSDAMLELHRKLLAKGQKAAQR